VIDCYTSQTSETKNDDRKIKGDRRERDGENGSSERVPRASESDSENIFRRHCYAEGIGGRVKEEV